MGFLSVIVVFPYSIIDTNKNLEKSSFLLSDGSYFYEIDN